MLSVNRWHQGPILPDNPVGAPVFHGDGGRRCALRRHLLPAVVVPPDGPQRLGAPPHRRPVPPRRRDALLSQLHHLLHRRRAPPHPGVHCKHGFCSSVLLQRLHRIALLRPVTSSTRRTPKEQTSLLSVRWYVLRYSGSTYPAAPFTCVEMCVASDSSAILARSKPVTFAVSAPVSSTFDDRMSRWMIGRSATMCFRMHVLPTLISGDMVICTSALLGHHFWGTKQLPKMPATLCAAALKELLLRIELLHSSEDGAL